MSKKYGKYIANIFILFALIGITYYLLFRGQEFSEILDSLILAKNSYLILGIVFVIGFVCSESYIIYYLMKAVKRRIPMIYCIKYSFIGFFFSAITPSASGGQPMQIYYMNKDNIEVAISSVVLIIVTAMYKLVLIFLCLILGIANWTFVSARIDSIWFLVLFGVVANGVFIGFLFVAIYKQSFARKLIGKTILWLGKKRMIKNHNKILKKAFHALKRYELSAGYIKENKRVLVNCFFITLIQRILLFAVTFLVYKAFSLRGYSVFQIISLQAFIALAADSLPLPGGIGATESSFLILFAGVFTEEFVLPGMLLSRGITYYALILMSAAVMLVSQLMSGRKKIIGSGR